MSTPLIREQIADRVQDVFERLSESLGDRSFSSSKPLSSSTYIIAMLPRTGSTALCSLLAQTGMLGFPDEYLNPRGPLQRWAQVFAARDVAQYFDTIRRERATENRLFGLKTTYDDFKPLLDSESVSSLLGNVRIIYLTRNDVLGQAVSEYIAEQTGIWHHDAAGIPLNSAAAIIDRGEVEFNARRIIEIVDILVRMQQSWERFFVLYSISPLRISYEDLSDDASRVVRRVTAHLGIDWGGEISLSDAATSKMADSRNADWATRLRSKFQL